MKRKPNKKASVKNEQIFPAQLSGAICAVLCLLILAFTASDCEKYSSDDSVPVSISFSPPKEAEEEGFWDIFSEAVVRLFRIEG